MPGKCPRISAPTVTYTPGLAIEFVVERPLGSQCPGPYPPATGGGR
jgi:hypothetical protein